MLSIATRMVTLLYKLYLIHYSLSLLKVPNTFKSEGGVCTRYIQRFWIFGFPPDDVCFLFLLVSWTVCVVATLSAKIFSAVGVFGSNISCCTIIFAYFSRVATYAYTLITTTMAHWRRTRCRRLFSSLARLPADDMKRFRGNVLLFLWLLLLLLYYILFVYKL